jgi:hypothetical protein
LGNGKNFNFKLFTANPWSIILKDKPKLTKFWPNKIEGIGGDFGKLIAETLIMFGKWQKFQFQAV